MKIAIIGGGPACLMAANTLKGSGHEVHLFEKTKHIGTKFLVAGKGGFNLSNNTKIETFHNNYDNSDVIKHWIDTFSPQDLRDFLESLNIDTYVGTSNRIFPNDDITPGALLKIWLNEISSYTTLHTNMELTGFSFNNPSFEVTFNEEEKLSFDKVILGLGAASWPQTGSDAKWAKTILPSLELKFTPFEASNVGLDIEWTPFYLNHHSYKAIKEVKVSHRSKSIIGDIMVSDYGLEGTPIYAFSSQCQQDDTIYIDLKPKWDAKKIANRLSKQSPKKSSNSRVRSALKLEKIAIDLLFEADKNWTKLPNEDIATFIKNVPIEIEGKQSIDQAISCKGGINLEQLSKNLMHPEMPGLYCVGEMLNWDTTTGGYLLQACFSSGYLAGKDASA